MRHLTIFLLLFSINSFSQEEFKTLEAFNLNFGLQILQPSSLHYDSFKMNVNEEDFFLESSLAENSTSDKLFSRQFLSGGLQLRILKEKKIWVFKRFNLNIGGSFTAGQNLDYSFVEDYKMPGDSVWITQGNNTQLYFSDSLYHKETHYYSQIKNVGLFSEFWLSSGEKNTGFSIGIGVSGQFAIENKLNLIQDTYYSTALFDQNGNPAYIQPTSTSLNNHGVVYSRNLIDTYNNSVNLSSFYSITTYVPIKVEAALSEDNLLKNFSVDLHAKIGYEFQFLGSNLIANRLSYILGVGLNYYL